MRMAPSQSFRELIHRAPNLIEYCSDATSGCSLTLSIFFESNDLESGSEVFLDYYLNLFN